MKKLYIITLLLAMMSTVMAQTPNIRYVAPDGAYANDGKSWGSPKKNIQDAINDLVDNGLTGEVWVKGATDGTARYTPTESTEQSGGSTLYMAFKIPAGITVKGGFTGTTDGVENKTTRPFTTTSKTLGKVYTYKTILSGRLASTPETFGFDNDKQRFTPKFYGNTYHVVWFAMNGFDSDGRARALTGGQAVLEGCIVEGGHANNNDLTGRKHNAYGGGIYMVDGAVVRDCEIRHCDASRDGGGVYMDGGGLLQHSYIHDCQALGVGVENGFGGGVCLEGVKQGGADNMTVIMQSVVSNNVARMGGGLALKVNDTAKRTKLAASSVLVNNNTSTTAAGGVMLYKGGAVAGLTIVRNRCNGSGIMVNGMQSGRAGGLFVLDKANIANSVIWGNQCDANNNIQYASHRTTNDNALKPDMKFCSIMNADLCDWSGTVKKSVRSLHANNRELTDANIDPTMGYALFENPTATAGYIANLGELNKGMANPSAEVAEKPTTPINWQVFSESAIHHAGIQTVDIDKEGETDSPAETLDVCGSAFNPRVTLGAYVAAMPHIVPQVDGSNVNFYVDPNHVFGHHTATANGNGHSWAEPTRYLANVLYLIKHNQVKDAGGTAIDLSGKTINIYIKEGTINNTNSYVSNMRVRNVAIEVPSNVNIYGGYPSTLTDTDVSTRNPRLHQTIITGDIMGDFETNVSHLVVLDNVQNVTIDGVQIRDANATSTLLASHGTEGAALTIKTSTTGINIKNVLIANNQAVQGAAVLAENSTVNFENCIFHNNTSSGLKGIIASTGSSQLNFDHCDVLRNVGHASWLDGTSTNYWKNSILYGNLRAAVENTNVNTGDLHDDALPAFDGANIAGAQGDFTFFDAQSEQFKGQFGGSTVYTLSYNISHEDLYPRFINPTRNSGHSIGGDVTFYGRSTSFEPHNLNPIVNRAYYQGTHDTWGKDMSTVTTRDFGGLPDIGAIENHMDIDRDLENTYLDGQRPYGSVYYVRDYNTYDENGVETAVDTDIEGRDGTSWEHAINGNGMYDTTNGSTLKNYTLSDLQTSTLGGQEHKYKIGMLGANNPSNPVYFAKNKSGNTMHNTTTNTDGDTFIVIDANDTKDGQPLYYIYNVTKSMYVYYTDQNNGKNKVQLQASSEGNTKWFFRTFQNADTYKRYYIIPSANNYDGNVPGWNYNGGVGQNLGLYNVNDSQSKWQLWEETEVPQTTTVNGLQYAVIEANAAFTTAGGAATDKREVWVGEGRYTNIETTELQHQKYAYKMLEGVDVFGGFPGVGNPAKDERNPKLYVSYLQPVKIEGKESSEAYKTAYTDVVNGYVSGSGAASIGRVLVQDNDFIVETVWNGFTLRHGYLHSCYRQNITGNLYAIDTKNIGGAGGAGAFIQGNGVLENCEVKNNFIFTYPGNASPYISTTLFQHNVTGGGGYHQAGAGVYMKSASGVGASKGTIKNSVIDNNQLCHKLGKQGGQVESSWMYGAGLYMDNGVVFNTIISNNKMEIMASDQWSAGDGGQTNFVLVGAAAALVNGEFYNNTVVDNKELSLGCPKRHIGIPGIYIKQSFSMYNCLISGNKSLTSPANQSTGTTRHFGYPVITYQNNGGDNYPTAPGNITANYCFVDLNFADGKNLLSTNDSKKTNIYLDRAQGGETASYNVEDDNNVYDGNYHLIASSPCFNTGTDNIAGIPDEDADYTFRIKDCAIDIGAFELNGAVGITPDVTTEPGKAIYYVTPNGYGTRAANDPENAACAQKLQKVIDAAGRYKFEHPTVNVVVKVANSYDFEKAYEDEQEKVSPDPKVIPFKYYATRSTNKADENVRVWSIIIPRGVEVWGGYSDVTLENGTPKLVDAKRIWTNADNGFYGRTGEIGSYTYTSRRNITGTPTYFDSYYENKLDHSNANCYHVVTFSDRVFDAEGNPYLKTEAAKVASGELSAYNPLQDEEESAFLHMSDVIRVGNAGITNTNLHRAVLDGIFVTGGKADAQGAGGSTTLNINQYGGAAIVTDYAHVRNCILKNNVANNGGALALTHKAVVSGTLMVENSANKNGGALYVFEEGDQLSDGTVIASLNNDSHIDANNQYGRLMDANMAHVFTSTIVRNQAPKGAGGGIWFTENNQPNVRINSSVFWQNTALDQANVAGMLSPEKPVDDQHSAEEFYPFAYSAIQDIRASGTNNFAVNSINSKGVRFANTTSDGTATPVLDNNLNANDNISPKYGLIGYSTLTHTGMPVNNYTLLMNHMAVAEADYTGVSRTVNTSAVPRTYVEVGARAIDKQFSRTQPMYRLFVAKPEHVNMAAAKAMMTSDNDYYKQEGSSFAYPFQSLQDALDYIHLMRYSGTNGLLTTHGANNIPFEICVAKGVYHPKRDLVGNTDHALSATFAIPEGVSIYGGFNCEIARDDNGAPIGNGFYGKGFESVDETAAKAMATPAVSGAAVDIYSNVTKVAVDKGYIEITDNEITYKIVERPDDYILSKRVPADLNANSIREPWEFEHQTFFSGDASAADNNGVYHVITIVPDENIVGTLPVANETYITTDRGESSSHYGMDSHMKGQQITIDGIQIQDGYAYHYVTDAFTDDPTSDYNYYHGGGILIDGNRYCDVKYGGSAVAPANPEGKTGVVTYKHTGRTNAVGYRDIPVNIKNCKFVNNRGGFGGAISSNTTLNIFQSSFEQNMAVGMTENITHNSQKKEVHYPGNGGAIHSTYRLHAFNTLFANNEAMNSKYAESMVPSYYHTLRNESQTHTGLKILGGAGGAISVGKVGIFHVINCNFVKNKANMYPAVFTMNPNYSMADGTDYTEYSKFANTVFWGNAVNENMPSSNSIFNFASKLICNFGQSSRQPWNAGQTVFTDYNPAFTEGNAPADLAALDANYQETAWFCAYEDGTGKTANHNEDMRDKEYSPLTHVENIFKTSGGVKQNCNIIISKENNVLEGPNFVNPSHDAGVVGYLESADWSPARINNLTDNGSGKISQTIALNAATQKYSNTYDTYTSKSQSVPGDRSAYSNETETDYMTSGIYTTNHYLKASPQFRQHISLGDAKPYMQYVNGDENIYRISFDPNPTHDHTYVDIGVYEYVHVQLNPTGDEVDVLWVSTDEKPENGPADGHAWTNPTSDLQRAIETLLASRNGHRKEVRLMDGTFTPTYTIDGNLSFYIDTHRLNQNVILPLTEGDNPQPIEGEGVKSLTIKGGYSKDLEGEYDVERYPAIIKGQQRTESGSERWNHAFYIYDATQRYGLKGGSSQYTSSNNYGATKQGQDAIQTIPIEVDGITFINDQALAGTKGTGLYYEHQNAKTSADHNLGATTGTSTGKGQKITQYYKDEAKTIPSDVPTPYYYYTNVDIQTPAALIISKCKFYGNGTLGADDKTTSAVYVGTKGAIKSLIYNNVFHTNEGKPLEAYNATTINNTYGLNGSYIDLMNEGAGGTSSILNSAMWRNNPTVENGVYGVQAKIGDTSYGGKDAAEPTSGDMSTVFNYNAFTMAVASNVNPVDNVNKNASLANDNSDLFNGPNFIDPENADLAKRNFNLMPSFRLLNTGLNTNYDENLVEVVAAEGGKPALYSAGIYDLAQYSTVDYDAALNTRKIGTAIDLGAYEYQNVFQRVFYVDPNSTKVGNDGKTWEDAMCYGSIQDAVNMGALYSKANSKEAYVFVKGASATNKGLHTGETITPRNGVKVFGSIAASYNKLHNANPKTQEATDGEVTAFEAQVINDRMGLAEPISNKTTIAGIKTSAATNFTGVTVIDGFDVTATSTENATGAITEPIININPNPNEASPAVKQLALRNLIVRDNDASAKENVNIVEVDKALIYEVLMRDNKVNAASDAVLKLKTNGYAVNVTVEGKSQYNNETSALNGGTHIYNSLVNYDANQTTADEATWKTLSGYNYELEDKNLNYQLAEMSKHIDGCATTNPVAGITEIEGFIDYAHDRDLLGNPRMMKLGSEATNLIDRGAFETWKVDVNAVITDAGVPADATKDHNGWSGIHYYPHDGSVVYIMEGNNLVSNHDLTPGFLLVQKGASLYGQGKAVNAAYVAVERMIKKDGSIVALPYAMKYKQSTENAKNIGAAAPNGYDINGVLSFSSATAHAYNYSGSERSAWDYLFARKDQNATSECWNELTSADDVTEANNGALYVANGFGESEKEKLIRFTGKGENMSDYIYTESGVSKTVELRKYDDSQTDNHGADFTNPLDMGWNCFGIPYLVSEYKPYEKVTADAGANTVVKDEHGTYTMSRSHTLWLYYDGVKSPDSNNVDGDGGYYSVKSWKSSDNLSTDNPWHVTEKSAQAIWVGEGIFTQTATLDDTESLVFYRPVYDGGVLGGAKGTRIYGDPTSIEETMEEDMKAEDVELVNTEYFTTDGVQINKPRRGAIVIIKRTYSNGAVKATKQFVK